MPPKTDPVKKPSPDASTAASETPLTVDFWQREAARHGQSADQFGARMFTVMSFGLAAVTAIVVGALVKNNALLLTFAPLVGLFAAGLVALSAFHAAYASIRRVAAEEMIEQTLVAAGIELDQSPYRRQSKSALGTAVWWLGGISAVVMLVIVDISAIVQNDDNWLKVRTESGTFAMWVLIVITGAQLVAFVVWVIVSGVRLRRYRTSFEHTA